MNNQLKEYLQSHEQYKPTFGTYLANHLPMAVMALSRMGANIEEINCFSNVYRKKLEVKETRPLIAGEENWQVHLGSRNYQLLKRCFLKLLEEKGWRETLEEVLPILGHTPEVGAFHALIRLGYALEFDNVEEGAEALSYWAGDFYHTPYHYEDGPSWKEVDQNWAEEFQHATDIEGRGIEGLALSVAMKEGFRQINLSHSSGEVLPAIKEFAIDLFLKTQNFTALHLVTGVHSAEVLSHFISPAQFLERGLLKGALAVALTIKSWKRSEKKITRALDREELKQVARNSLNDHVIKIIDICLQDYQHTGDERYLQAASLYVS